METDQRRLVRYMRWRVGLCAGDVSGRAGDELRIVMLKAADQQVVQTSVLHFLTNRCE